MASGFMGFNIIYELLEKVKLQRQFICKNLYSGQNLGILIKGCRRNHGGQLHYIIFNI